jgi:hypothetical protein
MKVLLNFIDLLIVFCASLSHRLTIQKVKVVYPLKTILK